MNDLEYSIIIPVRNEKGNLIKLNNEIKKLTNESLWTGVMIGFSFGVAVGFVAFYFYRNAFNI